MNITSKIKYPLIVVRTTITSLAKAVYRQFRPSRPWYLDICDYYQVTPIEAIELGTRSAGRRPNLPGSATTHAVTGKTFEEIWESNKRQTPSQILSFWQDMGAWATFRQVFYHRASSFKYLKSGVHSGSHVCEYGAGAAPLSFWLVENIQKTPFSLTLVDVPSEHLNFGGWRVQRRIRESGAPITLKVLEVQPEKLPLEQFYDLVTILEVYEHLHNPLTVTTHICEHLRTGGLLWENYIAHDHPHASDLHVAQQERPLVFEYLRQHCELIEGADPDSAAGMKGGTRCWKRS